MMWKRFFLTISATWIFVLVYYARRTIEIEHGWWIYLSQHKGIGVFVLMGTIIMIACPFMLVNSQKGDNLDKARLVELVDNSYIPTYLGYFFVSMSVNDFCSMIVFYSIIVIFTYFSGIEYFNPIFLFMGYHIYKVESEQGVQNIIILKTSSIVRSSNDFKELKLHRINNMTYIGKKKEE